jgi:ribosomal protein S18 acetylase RimI-like enzyme
MSDVRIRPLERQDSAAAAAVHVAAFPSFFLSSLGERFLRELYVAFAEEDDVVAVIVEIDGRLAGAAAGPLQPAGFFRRLALRRFLPFAIAALPAVMRRPSIGKKVLGGLGYRGPETDAAGALLSTICVSPTARSAGVGSALLGAWCQAAVAAGATRAFLTTDREENSQANAFYVRNGWKVHGTLVADGARVMNVYRTDLASVT